MWNNIVNEGNDLQWVVDALTQGMAISVTYYSFNWATVSLVLVSGAGWILYCTSTEKKLCGFFFERFSRAGSYRGELLGLLAIHTLTAAPESFFRISITTVEICGGNQNTLFK